MEVSRKIDKLGRIVLPMDFRRVLGIEGEAEVCVSINGNAILVKGKNTSCRLCGSVIDVSTNIKLCSDCIKRVRENDM